MSELLNSVEAAAMLRIQPGTLEVWRVYGKGPKFCKIGRRTFYKRDAVQAFIDSNETLETRRTGQPAPRAGRAKGGQASDKKGAANAKA